MKVKIAPNLGYCSGVAHAIEKAIDYAKEHGKVSSIGTIAHNEAVVERLRSYGIEPIKPEHIQPGTHVAITAHGSPPWVYDRIVALRCQYLDCTCPIVRRAQEAAASLHNEGLDILIFGDPKHQEVRGLQGHGGLSVKYVGNWANLFDSPPGPPGRLELGEKVGVISQTTQIPTKFFDFVGTLAYNHIAGVKELRIINTICPIVAKRIEEAENLAEQVDIMFVVGSAESANTQNLATVCKAAQFKLPTKHWAVFIVQNPTQVEGAIWECKMAALNGIRPSPNSAGVTAGTSTPIEMVEAVVEKLRSIETTEQVPLKCGDCEHLWENPLTLPMEACKFTELLSSWSCPACGSKKCLLRMEPENPFYVPDE